MELSGGDLRDLRELGGLRELRELRELPALVATVGMFDGLHAGHRHLLRQLRELGQRLGMATAVVTFSNHPLEVVAPDRAPAALLPRADKLRALRAVGIGEVICLDFTETLRQLTAGEFLAMLRKDYGVRALLLGYNNRLGHDAPRSFEEYQKLGRDQGVEIFLAEEYRTAEGEKVSSSVIRKLLEEGDVAKADRLLGHPYALRGKVVKGHQLGRTIGFPTANIEPEDPRQLIPREGVYAARTLGHAAMVNIGRRPTVGGHRQTIEVHIIGLSEDLYGHELTVEFLRRLRDEQKFECLDQLRQQLLRDQATSLEVFAKQKPD